jgi:pimeloyl-ACP methyl ester carboxylesterase
MGGAHVAAVAAAAPERVRALVLEDPHWPGVPEDCTADDINTWTADIPLTVTDFLTT